MHGQYINTEELQEVVETVTSFIKRDLKENTQPKNISKDRKTNVCNRNENSRRETSSCAE